MSRRLAGGAGAGRVQLPLFDGAPSEPQAVATLPDPDAEARAFAVDPRHNVVLEASAGTGKTSVLVARYVNLLKAGVDPDNILAITFTRKAAAEMRERIVRELRTAAERSELDRARWSDLRDRLGDIAISTIDAFCLSLLREFPLEADVDPGFDLADETEVPRLVGVALDRTLRILVDLARTDADVALVLAQLGIARTRDGLATLLDRRLVAREALDRFLTRGPRALTAEAVCASAARALESALRDVRGGLREFLADGPAGHPRYALLVREVGRLESLVDAPPATVRAVLDRIAGHFLTNEGKARKAGSAVPPYRAEHYPGKEAARRHRERLFELAPRVEAIMFAFARDLNVVLARGIRRMFEIALVQYRQALEDRSVLDFSDVLQRAVELLRRMDEFSQSRFRLESRYHHVLVDEFQDTSRAQWELVSLLVEAWGEGVGVAANPSIFVVGDRKQSIYRFRDAEVAVLQEAAAYIDRLRPDSRARKAIVRSFRAVAELQVFVNDVFSEMAAPGSTADEFTYDERDRFPVGAAEARSAPGGEPALGVAVSDSADACAAAVADEIARLLAGASVRDKSTGVARAARPGDIAILFRSRTSHREFERELGLRGIPTYVYKGLGFFDADEVKDLTALLRYLADPSSPLRAAGFLRSRFIRLSDPALAALAPHLSSALLADSLPVDALLDPEDRRTLEHARPYVRRWLETVDLIPPAELLDQVLNDSAYAFELAGPRQRQARENVKKMRGLVRRLQNRGYATMPRISEYLMSLSAGDESNAVVEALDAVNLMTVHASKGLEFPIVFVVNLAKGASGPPRPVRVIAGSTGADGLQTPDSVSVGPFISETDEAERDRERHETRRLLYVALTRARDRLYLSSTLKDGVLVPGRGSLAEVLPESLKRFLAHAQTVLPGVDLVGWSGQSGHEYTWRLCRPSSAPPRPLAGAAPDGPDGQDPPPDDFGPPASGASPLRTSVGELVGEDNEPAASVGPAASDRVLGLLVHRLIESVQHMPDGADRAALRQLALRLLRPEERAMLEDVEALAARAADAWLRAMSREDVRAALEGRRLHEVPFSLLGQENGRRQIVRGTIDLLVTSGDGTIRVVELKTGRRSAAHARQLDVYVRAARALFPGVAVDGVLLYL